MKNMTLNAFAGPKSRKDDKSRGKSEKISGWVFHLLGIQVEKDDGVSFRVNSLRLCFLSRCFHFT